MLKTILKWVVLVVLVTYAVGATVWAHDEARKNLCKGINIEITEGYSADSLTKQGVLSEIQGYNGKIIGEQISSINSRDIERYLKSFPQFEDVTCSFTTAGELQVKVIPMIPELRIFQDSLSYYINKEGKRMKSKASFFVDVPVVTGKFNDKFTPAQLLPVSRYIMADPVLNHLIGMIHADDIDNIILVPRIQGHVINFGDTTRLDEKRRALLAMYKKVMPYKGWEEYDTISVKFRGQVVATRRNKGELFPRNNFYEETDLEEATLPEIEYSVTQNE